MNERNLWIIVLNTVMMISIRLNTTGLIFSSHKRLRKRLRVDFRIQEQNGCLYNNHSSYFQKGSSTDSTWTVKIILCVLLVGKALTIEYYVLMSCCQYSSIWKHCCLSTSLIWGAAGSSFPSSWSLYGLTIWVPKKMQNRKHLFGQIRWRGTWGTTPSPSDDGLYSKY